MRPGLDLVLNKVASERVTFTETPRKASAGLTVFLIGGALFVFFGIPMFTRGPAPVSHHKKV